MKPEDALQCACVEWLEIQQRLGNVRRWHHSPNEAKGNAAHHAKRKRMGVSAGFPDLLVYLPNGRCLHAELKTGKGRLTDAQKQWRDDLKALGIPWALVRSLDDLQAVVNRERTA